MSKKFKVAEPEIIISPKKRTGVNYNEIWGEYEYYVDLIPVKVIVSDIFRLPEYKVLAIVDNGTGGSVTIGDEQVPSELLTPSQDCDLCKTRRFRGKSYIAKEIATGDIKRFGGDCVKKVFGIDPAKFIRALDFFRALDKIGFDSGEESMGGGKKGISPLLRAIPLPIAVAVVKHALDERGYIKKEGKYIETDPGAWGRPPREEYIRTNQGKATADLCEDIFNDSDRIKDVQPNNELTDKVKEYWGKVEVKDDNSSFSQFQTDVKNILSSGQFRILDTSKLIFAVHNYQESLTAKEKSNEFIGTVGEKMLFTDLKLVRHNSFNSQFGLGHIWSFEDAAGNKLKKFGELSTAFRTAEGSGELYGDFNKGDMFTFIADIKKHEEYNGIKSTMLGRLTKPKPEKKLKEKLSEEFNRFAKY